MASPRRKAPRLQAPQTIEEATALLGRYSGLASQAEILRTEAAAAIAAIEAVRDQALAPVDEQAKGIFLQLRAWWAVAGDTLTEGKRKSYELAGCLLGVRTTPPSLKLPGKADEAAADLVTNGLAQFCRIKAEVDKPAVLKALSGWPELEKLMADVGAETVDDLIRIANLVAADEGGEFGNLDDLVERVKPVSKIRELGFRVTQKDEFFIDRAGEKPAAVEEVSLQEAAE